MSSPATFASLCADLLRAGQPVRFRASGSSMAPTVRDGDRITVAPLRGRTVRTGDILLYATERGLTAHRVRRRRPGDSPVFRVRGDAPGSPEERVEPGQALGCLETLERDGRVIDLCWAGRLLSLARLTRWGRLVARAWAARRF